MRRFLASLLLLVTACQQQPEHRKLDPETLAVIQKHDGDVPALVGGNNEFAFALYQQLAGKDGNLFFSPYSISNALAMTYAGARGNTAAEMKATLRFRLDDESLHPTFGNLVLKLEGDGKAKPAQLSVANRLWGQKGYDFVPGFLKISRDFYDGGLTELDFNNPDGSRQTINAWVARQTRDKIQDLIPSGEISSATRLVLTNAIYFKAPWQHPFKSAATRPDTFHLLDGKTVETPMMRAKESIGFADFEAFSMVNLSYKGGGQSMVVILPKKNDGLPDLEKELTVDNLSKWMQKLAGRQVDLKLPKLKMTREFKLNEVLKEMGMRDAFYVGKADLSGIATDERLFISAVLHKAFVVVNEEGTEAAAATAVKVATKAPSDPAVFHADHPFVFLIRDQQTGSILFLGRVTNPVP